MSSRSDVKMRCSHSWLVGMGTLVLGRDIVALKKMLEGTLTGPHILLPGYAKP